MAAFRSRLGYLVIALFFVNGYYQLISSETVGLSGLDVAASVPAETDSNLRTDAAAEMSLETPEEAESHVFKAEVTRLLDLIINYLYTQKDRFIRELISNGVDALEKQRIKAFENNNPSEGEGLEIRVRVNSDKKTISIRDYGVGMTKSDLINNLGTVAKSGTTNFLESMAQHSDANLIGQFGVGFYSAYLVADKVTVISKHDDDVAHVWQSSADQSFSIHKRSDNLEPFTRGTEVILHLKADATEYLDIETLMDSMERFSQFMPFPIYLEVEKFVDVEVDEEEEEEDKDFIDADSSSKEVDVDVESDDEKVEIDEVKEGKKKTIKKVVREWEQINKQKPIWLRNKSEVTKQEYEDFYSSIAKDDSKPLSWIHFNAEGEIEFKSILYIPTKAPEDAYENYFTKQTSVKLYVRRVLVQEQFDRLLPKYLSFVKGVVDSDDVPLNVARDQLQEQKILKLISKKLIRKILELMKKLSTEGEKEKDDLMASIDATTDEKEKEDLNKQLKEGTTYDKLWSEFGKHLKLGCFDDDVNRVKVARLLRIPSTKHLDGYTTLDRYIQNMPETQSAIYYASGASVEQLMSTPQLQVFLKKGIEVLLLVDTMDEPCMQKLTSYEGKKLSSIQKGDVDLDESASEKKRQKKLVKLYEPLTRWFSGVLKSQVGKVEISKRLVDAPCTVVSASWGYSAQMEKILKSQTFSDHSNMKFLSGAKTLELNPNHPVIIHMLEKVKENPEDEELKNVGSTLFHMAMLSSGFDVEKPASVSDNVYRLIALQAGINPDAEIEMVNVDDIEADDEETEEESEDIDADVDSFLKNVKDTPALKDFEVENLETGEETEEAASSKGEEL